MLFHFFRIPRKRRIRHTPRDTRVCSIRNYPRGGPMYLIWHYTNNLRNTVLRDPKIHFPRTCSTRNRVLNSLEYVYYIFTYM